MTDYHSRRLPHYDCIGRPTSSPGASRAACRSFASLTSGKAFLAMDRLLDNPRTGPLYLREPKIANMVVDAIRCRKGGPFRLHNYVVMANHVHLLITPLEPVPHLMQSLKRFTAREGNRILALTAQTFWQEESYDRLVRDELEFQRIARYIEMNPVHAGLVSTPGEFPWSSAWPIDNRPQIDNLPHIRARPP